ncbi:MAG: hypothetical protein F4Y86_15350 [Gammaproteobacteria bacterium]|nr:hypothetical protein [Gammaproteobacteria bacterium]
MENRDKVFPIDSRLKFNPIILQRGGKTDAINTAFMRRKPEDWERAEDIGTPYSREQVQRFSPRSRAILEIQSARDLEILEKVYANGILLGDDGRDGWGITYTCEFHMTNDSRLFPPRPEWEAKGYRPDEYSRWLLGNWRPIGELWAELGVDPSKPEPTEIKPEDWLFDATAGPERREAEARFVHGHLLKPGDVARTDWKLRCAQPPYDRLPVPRARIPAGIVLSREGDAWIPEDKVEGVALPLYQGIMIQPFYPSARGWLSGTGLRAKWDHVPSDQVVWNPQYLMALDEARRVGLPQAKVGFRDISRDTDVRSFMGALLPMFPCGHSAPVLHAANAHTPIDPLLLAFVNSFVFDWMIRQRGGAAHLIWSMLSEMALPRNPPARKKLDELTVALNPWAHPSITTPGALTSNRPSALTASERVRLRANIDALAAIAYGLSGDDLNWILKDVDLPAQSIGRSGLGLDPRGFWRVDRSEAPELRHTVLTQVAFHDLESRIQMRGSQREGINSFLG